MLILYDFQTEYRSRPLGLDVEQPGFSWKLSSSENNTVQQSYRIVVFKENELQWDSGVVQSDRSLYVLYEGASLQPATEYIVQITVVDNHGEEAHIEGAFETGLMTWKNFKADWITHAYEDNLEACAVFVKRFAPSGKVVKARAYVSALGLYELKLNGNRVSDARFTPGWTSYQERLQYQTYDITNFLTGENCMKITVGNGWYKGILGFYGQGNHYGTRTAVIAQIELTYEDGSREQLLTDESWRCTTAEHRYNDIYNGEVIDFSLDTQEELPVHAHDYPKHILVGQETEPVTITQRLEAKELIISPKGEKILDFGQNMAGVVEARLCCPKGTVVTISHAETLDENGNFFTTNLRTAKATDVFICSGGEDVFLPGFTYHGFRYIKIEGLDEIHPEQFTACVIHTDLRQTGTFSCANEDINQLWRNIDWTMRSNFLDIPMDCPQRDERLGYTGDTEIFLPTAAFHKNVALFFRKWLRDLKVEQTDEFGVPLSVPDILRTRACVNIWHDAAAIVPWHIWQTYGDIRVLQEQYDSMKSCVEYTRRVAGEGGLLSRDNSGQFGDWLSLDAPKGPYRRQTNDIMYPSMDEKAGGTDTHLIANVYYLNSIDIMARTAAILGRAEDERTYRELYETVLGKFRGEYITPGGRLVTETQTTCALMLYFNLMEEKDRAKVIDCLTMDLVKNKKQLRTGFSGTQFITKALSRNGLHALAGDILLQEECPSWLYCIRQDATTIWELWDGVNPDGSMNLFEMNSLNQFGFGTVGDWMHQEMCGIQCLAPGYKKSRIAPRLIKGIPSVSASLETVYGQLSCAISCKNGVIKAEIRVPENTTAVISIPEQAEIEVGSGSYSFEYETELSFDKQRYSEDSLLNDLLQTELGEMMFETEAPELASNGFIRTFAGGLSIIEIKKTLPRTMVPEKAIEIFEKIIVELNKADR